MDNAFDVLVGKVAAYAGIEPKKTTASPAPAAKTPVSDTSAKAPDRACSCGRCAAEDMLLRLMSIKGGMNSVRSDEEKAAVYAVLSACASAIVHTGDEKLASGFMCAAELVYITSDKLLEAYSALRSGSKMRVSALAEEVASAGAVNMAMILRKAAE